MKYICDKCKKEFKKKDHYDNHMKRKIPCVPDLTCPDCGVTFSRLFTLNRHLKNSKKCNKSNDDEDEELSESLESSETSTEQEEKILENKKWVCHVCKKWFDRKYNYERHMKSCISKTNKSEITKALTAYEEKIHSFLNKIDNNIINNINVNRSNVQNLNNAQRDVNIDNRTIDNSTNINIQLTSIIRPNIDFLKEKDVQKWVGKRNELDMMTQFIQQVFSNDEHPENHNMYLDSDDILHRFTGNKWIKNKISDFHMTKTLQIVLYAIEKKLRITDPDAQSRSYKKLLGVREYSNIERMACEHRREFGRILRGMEKKGKIAKAKWKAENNIPDSDCEYSKDEDSSNSSDTSIDNTSNGKTTIEDID